MSQQIVTVGSRDRRITKTLAKEGVCGWTQSSINFLTNVQSATNFHDLEKKLGRVKNMMPSKATTPERGWGRAQRRCVCMQNIHYQRAQREKGRRFLAGPLTAIEMLDRLIRPS